MTSQLHTKPLPLPAKVSVLAKAGVTASDWPGGDLSASKAGWLDLSPAAGQALCSRTRGLALQGVLVFAR